MSLRTVLEDFVKDKAKRMLKTAPSAAARDLPSWGELARLPCLLIIYDRGGEHCPCEVMLGDVAVDSFSLPREVAEELINT